MLPRQRHGVSHSPRLGFRQDPPRLRQFLKPRRHKAPTLGTVEPRALFAREAPCHTLRRAMECHSGCRARYPVPRTRALWCSRPLSQYLQWQEHEDVPSGPEPALPIRADAPSFLLSAGSPGLGPCRAFCGSSTAPVLLLVPRNSSCPGVRSFHRGVMRECMASNGTPCTLLNTVCHT